MSTFYSASVNITSSLKDFLIQNNILTTVAAVTIAFSAGTFIRSLVSDIILPSVYSLLRASKINLLNGAFKSVSSLNADNFIKELLQFVLVIVFTFVIIVYVFDSLVMTKKKVVETESRSQANTAGSAIASD